MKKKKQKNRKKISKKIFFCFFSVLKTPFHCVTGEGESLTIESTTSCAPHHMCVPSLVVPGPHKMRYRTTFNHVITVVGAILLHCSTAQLPQKKVAVTTKLFTVRRALHSHGMLFGNHGKSCQGKVFMVGRDRKHYLLINLDLNSNINKLTTFYPALLKKLQKWTWKDTGQTVSGNDA